MLTLICGIPNAGKSTYSANYANVLHLDDFHGSFQLCSKKASKASGDICVEGIYNYAKRRKELIEMCRHQTPKICIWIDTPLNECIRREKAYRKRPQKMVEIHNSTFEAPTLDEGWDEIIRIKGGSAM